MTEKVAAPQPHVIEQYKAEKNGLDVHADLPHFAKYGYESIGKGDIERLKWWGVFLRRQSEGEPGFFMMRIRIPGGIATSEQIRCIGEITGELGRGIADITTRQQLQTRWIRIEDVPEILERFWKVGLVTLQTGMDNIRNIINCPVAGLTPNEALDATETVLAFNEIFVGNKEFTNLPRKFNVTITGCTVNCTHPETQDIGLVPATIGHNGDGQVGFNVLVGGKLGSGGYTIASPLKVFVSPGREAADVCAAIVLLFRDNGLREARNKARLSFLLDDWGIERFRSELEARLGWSLRPAGRDLRDPAAGGDHLGVQQQQQAGASSVGLAVPVGRLQADDLLALADLADRFGQSEVRLTTAQNAIIPHVSNARLDEVDAEPLLQRFPSNPAPLMRGLVSCTGTDYCNLAQIDTKKRAIALSAALTDKVQRSVSLHWSGCQAGCGNHAVGDIGIMGKKARIDGKVVEAADVFVGGSSGPNATPPLKILEDVPCDQLESVLEALLRYGALDAVKDLLRDSGVSPAPAEVHQTPQTEFRADDIPEGGGRQFQLNGSTVAVFKSEGKLFALQGNCPHADSALADGAIEGTEVTCPEHGYRFDIRNGVCLTDPGLRARVYRLINADDDVVRIEQPGSPVARGGANGSMEGKEQ